MNHQEEFEAASLVLFNPCVEFAAVEVSTDRMKPFSAGGVAALTLHSVPHFSLVYAKLTEAVVLADVPLCLSYCLVQNIQVEAILKLQFALLHDDQVVEEEARHMEVMAVQLSHREVLLAADAAKQLWLSCQFLVFLAAVAIESLRRWRQFWKTVAVLVKACAALIAVDDGAARFTLAGTVEADLALCIHFRVK